MAHRTARVAQGFAGLATLYQHTPMPKLSHMKLWSKKLPPKQWETTNR
jgi:hypothetical protein